MRIVRRRGRRVGGQVRLHPFDLALASARLYSSLPVVGRHLEPLAGLTAMALYGGHYARPAVEAAISRHFGEAVVGLVDNDDVDRVPPFLRAGGQRRKNLYRKSVQYGDHPAQQLDIWRRKDLPGGSAPVLLFVPGGAWVQGTRLLQGHTLLSHLVEQGWVCVTMDYRVSPVHRWPRHIADVNAAIAWARANVDKYGGDRDFVAIAGCSAGGHLASLAALTVGDPAFRGELTESADTSVDAVVGIYGRYDWQDRSTAARRGFTDFLERVVVQRKHSRHPDVYEAASPIRRIHDQAPPFLLIHGDHDSIIPVEEAREFRDALRARSRKPVEYVELPKAGHAFDLVDSSHARRSAVECTRFLESVYRDHAHRAACAVVAAV